ncbi:Clp protease N-terminal domain-containing protein [Sciscionella marina]|uniref:Clp protease N-terminal domain-containing protein n=1 Tax=Sciscionella marina TaxID=508770 RepID=UPI00036801F2|nr:Clp protease N-terminal domain-containing protein [Sciscionella marina]
MANIQLHQLIDELETQTPSATELERVGEAQRRAQSLADLGDQLVGHFVARARDTGASWAQIGEAIGVSKQAAQQRDTFRMYERFTDRARQALVQSQDVARTHNGASITGEHLLHGTLSIREGVAALIVDQLSGSLDTVLEQLVQRFPRDAETPPLRLVYAEMGRRVIDETVKVALKLNHNYVGTEHLLLGVLAAGGPAAALLNEHGVTSESAEPLILEKIDEIVANLKRQQQ